MKKFAVGYISFFENVLIVEIVEADDFKAAILLHSHLRSSDDDFRKWYDQMPDDLEEIKSQMSEGEVGIDVKEIV